VAVFITELWNPSFTLIHFETTTVCGFCSFGFILIGRAKMDKVSGNTVSKMDVTQYSILLYNQLLYNRKKPCCDINHTATSFLKKKNLKKNMEDSSQD